MIGCGLPLNSLRPFGRLFFSNASSVIVCQWRRHLDGRTDLLHRCRFNFIIIWPRCAGWRPKERKSFKRWLMMHQLFTTFSSLFPLGRRLTLSTYQLWSGGRCVAFCWSMSEAMNSAAEAVHRGNTTTGHHETIIAQLQNTKFFYSYSSNK